MEKDDTLVKLDETILKYNISIFQFQHENISTEKRYCNIYKICSTLDDLILVWSRTKYSAKLRFNIAAAVALHRRYIFHWEKIINVFMKVFNEFYPTKMFKAEYSEKSVPFSDATINIENFVQRLFCLQNLRTRTTI